MISMGYILILINKFMNNPFYKASILFNLFTKKLYEVR